MNVDEWIEYIMVSDKKVALPIMTHPGIELQNDYPGPLRRFV